MMNKKHNFRNLKIWQKALNIALGSSYELNTQLLISHHKNYISDEELTTLETQIDEWQRMTAGFQKTL